MEPAGPDSAASWDDAVNAVDATDHRSARRVHRDAVRHTSILHPDLTGPAGVLERRRLAAVALLDALAAYRLAGGTPAHLAAAARVRDALPCSDDVTGSIGERAKVVRERLRTELANAGRFPSVADVDLEQHAAALNQPRDASGSDRHAHALAKLARHH